MTTTLRRSFLGLGILCLASTSPLACGFDSSGVPGPGWGGGTHSTTHSSSGGGMAPGCKPGESIICYTGPVGTVGKGICTAGTKVCNDEGTGYGECMGEVTPQAEDCSTSLDDNCDGNVNESCPCMPGTMEPCYTGPMGTEGKGICKGSMHTCNPDGTGFGPCTGEVTPKTEDCSTPEDEDCDGQAFGATGSSCACEIGTTTMCMTGLQGVCAGGTQACTGDATASSYGACTPTSQPSTEDCGTPEDESCDGQGMCTGGSLSGKAAGVPTTKDDVAFGVAFDPSGAVIAGGVTNGSVAAVNAGPALGGTVSEGSLWLAKYAKDGTIAWEAAIAPAGNPAHAVAFGVATDAQGNVIAVGEYQGTLDFGGGKSITSDGSGTGTDAFVVKLDPTGAALWAKSFGAGGVQAATGVAVDSAGSVFISGAMQGTADFGNGVQTSGGSYDAFIVKLDGNGAHQWSIRAGDVNYQVAWGVAAAPNGDAVLVGEFKNNMNFGTNLNAGGDLQAFVIRFNGTNGNYLWGKMYGDGQDQAAYGVAVDAQGNPVVTGGFKGQINFGPGNVPSTNNNATTDVFVAKLQGSDGAHLWSKGFGTGAANNQTGTRVAIDALGNVVLTGSFQGTINFGTAMDLTNTGAATYDVFVAKLKGSDGSHLWSKAFGDMNDQAGWGVAVDALGNVAVAGGFKNVIDFGAPAGSLTSGGGYDIYAAKLQP